MAEEEKKLGRPKKEKPRLTNAPIQFVADEELGIPDMQAGFVWHYTEGACGQTEAARRAGFSFPANAASKMLNGRDHPKVTKAVRIAQEELREKYAITPEKTGAMLWNIAETSFEQGAYNDAVSAVKELNSLAGLSIQRSQNLNINANLERMTKEDIKERLNDLLGFGFCLPTPPSHNQPPTTAPHQLVHRACISPHSFYLGTVVEGKISTKKRYWVQLSESAPA